MHSAGSAPRSNSTLTLESVRGARELLRGIVPVSRVISADSLSAASRARVFLKLECEGPTGSFKVRGAYHAIFRRKESGVLRGVVTSSTGNHGAAVAYVAKLLGVPARVYLPENPNPVKRARIAAQGAEIIETGAFLEADRELAAQFAEESGWFNIVDGVEPEMLPGTATIGCEIVEQIPDVDVLFIPVGDSTLIRGVAFAAKQLRPEVKIIGVQAERAAAYALSFRTGHAVSTDSSDTIADGLAVRHASEENVREISALVDNFILVSEEEMLAAVRKLILEEHVIAEPSGAAATAALLKSGEKFAGKNVVLLVTGANIPEEILLRALQSR
ncbi:MAG TPA: threonine/serine dehydratase [Candidatus Limnocylindria bacterium]|nr:threonine/serine dehydratase [Candidatus Limnocylindria bacterium]